MMFLHERYVNQQVTFGSNCQITEVVHNLFLRFCEIGEADGKALNGFLDR